MSLLPDTERILPGPGASLTSPRVMRAMAAPTVGHLDPVMMHLMGASSSLRLIVLLRGALESALSCVARI